MSPGRRLRSVSDPVGFGGVFRFRFGVVVVGIVIVDAEDVKGFYVYLLKWFTCSKISM